MKYKEININILKFFLIGLSSTFLLGCISSKSYLDPVYPKLTYGDVKRPIKPIPLALSVEFQRNGESFPKAVPTVLDASSRILRATGVVEPDGPNSIGQVKITLNNVSDLAAARAKGFGTGLTFGLVGTTVTDNYELTMSVTVNGKTVEKANIKNAFNTTVGNTSIPGGLETFTAGVAVQKVLEQMILEAIKQIQADSKILSATDAVDNQTLAELLKNSFYKLASR
jgi:hypothetical protein